MAEAKAEGGFSITSLYQPTVLLSLALMTIIVMMILPIPAFMLDVGLAASFGLAVLIFTVTLFIERPLDFSSFPTILLASLMLRLSLNVSSTKLIIGQGHTGTGAAGGVIEGFAMFVMGGSLFLGLVVFLVLLIVNFMVITKGAGRMAEVGARFALDAMPGKQLAIDSDLAAGAITHEQARERRRIEQEETTFFGSLDGASKFVKGDAVAGLLITALNLLMGVGMGIGVHSMDFGMALETYAILTVGDGLVSQIPSVIISIAAALLLSKGGAHGAADKALVSQLAAHPKALTTVGCLMALFALAPGLPVVPFMIGGILLIGAGFVTNRTQQEAAKTPKADALPAPEAATTEKPMGDAIDLDDLHIAFAPDLVSLVTDPGTGLESRITALRRHLATDLGFVMPEVRITDEPTLPASTYQIKIHGVKVASDKLMPNKLLVLLPDDDKSAKSFNTPGDDAREPVYGAAARWIDPGNRDAAAIRGLPIITPIEVLATHLMETVQGNLDRLFTRRTLKRLLDAYVTPSDPDRARANQQLLDEFLPEKVSMDMLQAVLKLMLAERVSIRNLQLILEAISEVNGPGLSPEIIVEHVRRKIGYILTAPLVDDTGTLPLIQLDPSWEKLFAAHELDLGGGSIDVALPPQEFNRLAQSVQEKLNAASVTGRYAAVATSAYRRRFVREALTAKGVRNPVLSFEEIGHSVRSSLLGAA